MYRRGLKKRSFRLIIQTEPTKVFLNPTFSRTVPIQPRLPRKSHATDKTCVLPVNLNNYLLVANRKLTAQAEAQIRNHINAERLNSESTNRPDRCRTIREAVEAVSRCRIEGLNLDPVDSPLIIAPDDLATVVAAFAENKDEIARVIDDAPAERISYQQKNEQNNTSVDYAKRQRQRFLKYTSTVKDFLARPENESVLKTYEAAADEIELKIVSRRKDFQSFDKVLEYVADLLFKRDPDLRANKRLTRTLLFYMYWNCDIGTTDAEANEAL